MHVTSDFDMRSHKSCPGKIMHRCCNALIIGSDRMSHRFFIFTRTQACSLSLSTPHVWILSQWLGFPEISGSLKQTTTGGKTQLLSLPQRQGQSAEKWEWGLEFNYSLKALRVQYEREGWGINLLGCLCLCGGYNKKNHSKPTAETVKSGEWWFKVWQMNNWAFKGLTFSLSYSFL